MIVLLCITLWLLIGFLSFIFAENAWKVNWYKKFNEHYSDYKYNSIDRNLFYTILFTLGGIFTLLIIGISDGFRPKSDFYFSNSLWMIIYNKEKVEKHFNNLNKTK